MATKVDIFRGKPGDAPNWVTTVDNLDQAMDQLRRLAASTSEDYFVFDPHCGAIIPLKLEPTPAAA